MFKIKQWNARQRIAHLPQVTKIGERHNADEIFAYEHGYQIYHKGDNPGGKIGEPTGQEATRVTFVFDDETVQTVRTGVDSYEVYLAAMKRCGRAMGHYRYAASLGGVYRHGPIWVKSFPDLPEDLAVLDDLPKDL